MGNWVASPFPFLLRELRGTITPINKSGPEQGLDFQYIAVWLCPQVGMKADMGICVLFSPVKVWHNLVHLGMAIWGILVSRNVWREPED